MLPCNKMKIHRICRRVFSSINGSSTNEPVQLIFLRHGQSTWNQQNIFIGMTDTPLTNDGMREARIAGHLLLENNYGNGIDVVYTSLLRRSTKTVWIVMQELSQEWVPVIKDWRLNERNYGLLVGQNKKECVALYGKDQVKKWRRSWDCPPPPMSKSSQFWPGKDIRYKMLGVPEHMIPTHESLKDVTKRTSKFWDEVIVPQLKLKKKVLIVGHENNLRSIIKRLDDISNEEIINLELPRAIPLVYQLDPDTLKPIKMEGAAPLLSGKYLGDPEQLKRIAERDQAQVYDVSITDNLEIAPFLGQSPTGQEIELPDPTLKRKHF